LDKYIGIDFELGGRSESGIDCIGLVSKYLYNQGYHLPANDGDPITEEWHRENPGRLKDHIKKYCRQVSFDRLMPGDIVVFELYKKPRHIGVIVKNDKFLHIRVNKKSSIERLARWERFIDSCWRPIYKLYNREVI